MKRTNINSIISRAAMTLLLGVFTLTAQAQDLQYFTLYPDRGTTNISGQPYTVALDGQKGTTWCVENLDQLGSTPYIEFHTDQPIIPVSYVFTTGADNATFTGRNPKNWRILAKRYNNEPWSYVPVAEVTNDNVMQDLNTQDYKFSFNANLSWYQYFRIDFLENHGANEFQLGEIQIEGRLKRIVDLSFITSDYTALNGETLTGTLDTENYPVKISIADGATVTLNDVTINGIQNDSYKWAGITCLGDATIVLSGSNSVTNFSQYFSGIYIPEGKTLTIQGDGMLNVIVSSDSFASGIGAGAGTDGETLYKKHCGNIIIKGGTINATGGWDCAGIGGAQGINCGNITITSDVISVTVTKADRAQYSIGAGLRGTCGTVTIGNVVTGSISQSPFTTFPYTVAFNANGGTGTMANQTLMYSVPQSLRVNSFTNTNANSIFTKWNTEPDGSGIDYHNQQSVSDLASASGATVTLYAQWQRGELADGTAYYVEQDGKVTTATYTKTLGSERVGKHQAWMVPFDYTITTDDVEKFTFYKINMIANSPDPSVEVSNEVWVFLKKLNAGEVLHANMPYVYKPRVAVTDYSFTSNNATLKAKNTDVLAKAETLEDVYSFYGTYENTTPAASDPFYYVGIDGNLSLGNNGTVTVGPYRWILRKTSKYGGTSAYARNMHFFDPEEDETGISDAERLNDEGQMINDSWFSLDGRKLDGQTTRKGLYIHNGRKVVVE